MEKLSESQANEILADCVAGKDKGWENLFRQFRYLAYWVASGPKFQLPQEVSEDIVQETMLAVCPAIKAGKVKNLTAYVRGVAYNKCVDVIRKKEPIVRLTESEIEQSRVPDEIPLKYADDDSVAALSECLQNIGNPCSTLLAQRYYEDKSYKEVAASSSIPAAHVGVQIARCLGKIKKMLEQARPSFRNEFAELL